MWNFEPDAPQKEYKNDPMLKIFTFGKYKGLKYGEVMQKNEGRKYMQWLLLQKCDDPEWADEHEKRQDKIKACFEVYEAYKKSQEILSQ